MNDKQPRIDWGEAVVPGVTLLFAAAYFRQTKDASWAALYWPIIVAAIMGGLWILVVIRFLGMKRVSKYSPARPLLRREALRPAAVFFGAAGYIVCIRWIGFTAANFLFLCFLSPMLGARRPVRIVLTAAGVAVFLHLALVVLMKLSVPRLDLGFFIL